MASKMIGKSVKVIGGQNKGLVGWGLSLTMLLVDSTSFV